MIARIWLIEMLTLLCIVQHSAFAAGGQTSLAEVELIKQGLKQGLAGLPVDAPKPVLYFLDKARTPSCGLLPSTRGASMIIPILETDPGEDFPYCLEVTDGALFRYGRDTGFVFRYRQRDTREDSSTNYFFALQTSTGLAPLDKLNYETPPLKKTTRYLAAWSKLRLLSLENEKDSYQTSLSDSIVTESAILSVSRNATARSCRIAADLVSIQSYPESVTMSCNSVLASTSFISRKAIYFIVLIDTEDHRTKGLIFEARGNIIRESADMEQRLANQVSSRKILKVRESLRKFVESQ
jgi:hypothetical protein